MIGRLVSGLLLAGAAVSCGATLPLESYEEAPVVQHPTEETFAVARDVAWDAILATLGSRRVPIELASISFTDKRPRYPSSRHFEHPTARLHLYGKVDQSRPPSLTNRFALSKSPRGGSTRLLQCGQTRRIRRCAMTRITASATTKDGRPRSSNRRRLCGAF